MTPLFCTKGHENLIGNRFCSQCGEQLAAPSPGVGGQGGIATVVFAGTILGDRYRITREIGQGGFGRTYLAEDTHRFNERCVLKEFAPQVANPNALKKAQELFEREANVLYKLQHPQIPKFREIYQCSVAGTDTLLLVQDYVEGETYRALLQARRVQKQRFSEAEVIQLLLKLLPVLEYIHSQGMIHRDISPENLILRSSDNLPVLIDFGGVKEMAMSAMSKAMQNMGFQTNIGKPGYAPEEQIRLGKAYPCSDFYALAVTVLVLLSGKEPQEFYDSSKAIWLWRREVTISPNLAAVLEKMLAYKPGDRYQTAREVIQALPSASYEATVAAIAPYQSSNVSQLHTVVVSPKFTPQQAPTPPTPAPIPAPIPAPAQHPPIFNPWPILFFPFRLVWHGVRGVVVLAITIVLFAGIGVWAGPKLLSWIPPLPNIPDIFTDRTRPDRIAARRESLQISEEFFQQLVNELFLSQYPEYKGFDLTNESEDATLQQQWNRLADDLLNKLERANLSEEARRQMGGYTLKDYKSWNKKVNSTSLNRAADDRFYELFPELQGQQLNPATLGQVWYAIASDRVNNINAQSSF